jgi:hypothetical protein
MSVLLGDDLLDLDDDDDIESEEDDEELPFKFLWRPPPLSRRFKSFSNRKSASLKASLGALGRKDRSQ